MGAVTQEADADQAEPAPSETPIGLDPAGLCSGNLRVGGGQYLVLSSGAINRAQIFHRLDSPAKALVNAVVIVNFDATGL